MINPEILIFIKALAGCNGTKENQLYVYNCMYETLVSNNDHAFLTCLDRFMAVMWLHKLRNSLSLSDLDTVSMNSSIFKAPGQTQKWGLSMSMALQLCLEQLLLIKTKHSVIFMPDIHLIWVKWDYYKQPIVTAAWTWARYSQQSLESHHSWQWGVAVCHNTAATSPP